MLLAMAVLGTGIVQATDLRTTSGKTKIVRTIAHQTPANGQQGAAPMPMKPAVPKDGDPKIDSSKSQSADQPDSTQQQAPEPQQLDAEELHPTFDLHPGIGSGCATCSRWASVEYLLWWRRGAELPALVTTSTANTAQADAGVLGLSSTSILFGNERLASESAPGGRVEFGYWTDPSEVVGYGVRLFALGDDSFSYNVREGDPAIAARPFFNVATGNADARLINFPAVFRGTLDITGNSDVIGGDVFYRKLWCRTPRARLDFIAGYQFARITESVRINSRVVAIANSGTIAQGTVIDAFDQFHARNEFHGGHLGLMAEFDRGPWSLNLLAKLGLGNMRQRVSINGQTVTDVPMAGTAVTAAGLLAQPSNSGVFQRDEFSAVPEIGINCKWHMACNIDMKIGYSLVYWNNVVQPGSHMDLNVNPTQLPGPVAGTPAPNFQFNPSSYWVHGLNLGLEVTF